MRTDKKKKRLKLDSRFFARLLVVLLALSMLVGAFYYVIIFSHIDAMAIEPSPEPVNPTMRVAIFYDDKIAVDVKLTSESGFKIAYTGGGRYYTEVTTLPHTALFVARHYNLYYNGTRYVKATSDDNTSVGTYHICIKSDENYWEDVELIKEAFPEYNVFPGNYDGGFSVLIGQFVTLELAEAAFAAIKEILVPEVPEQSETESGTEDLDPDQTTSEGESTSETSAEVSSTVSDTSVSESTTVSDQTTESSTTVDSSETTEPETSAPESDEPEEGILPADLTEAILEGVVYTPRSDGVIVIDPNTHNIVWAFVHDPAISTRHLGIGPCDTGSERSYMRCYHGNSSSARIYDGIFECSAAAYGSFNGIKVINMVKLENYIEGVICAEIGVGWSLETMKAFAVCVRNFSIRSLGRHSGMNADLCNEANCQVFNGYALVTDRVKRAVKETADIILFSSNNQLCATYYSSSTGGCTANCTDVWGSSLSTYPYLKAVATPWEKYTTYNKGQRTTTITGTELYNLLNNKGYTGLTGPVTDVKITATGNNTTYVTQIKFYDASGNVVTVNRADKIKKLLSSYVYSSNFVVTPSGQDVTRTNYTMLGFGGVSENTAPGVSIEGNPDKYKVLGRQLFSVVTSNGKKSFYDSESISVITADGVRELNMTKELDSQYYPTVIGTNGSVLPDILNLSPIITSETISTTYKENSFTFISRGWGHGVGMSQHGIKELGILGYDYQTILKAYYSGVRFRTYYECVYP